jgi:hypothetical protein
MQIKAAFSLAANRAEFEKTLRFHI